MNVRVSWTWGTGILLYLGWLFLPAQNWYSPINIIYEYQLIATKYTICDVKEKNWITKSIKYNCSSPLFYTLSSMLLPQSWDMLWLCQLFIFPRNFWWQNAFLTFLNLTIIKATAFKDTINAFVPLKSVLFLLKVSGSIRKPIRARIWPPNERREG